MSRKNTFESPHRPTKRAPDAGDSAQISSSFTRLIIFLAGRLRRPHPSAGNANRWVAQEQKPSLNNKFGSGIGSEIQSPFLAAVFFKPAFRWFSAAGFQVFFRSTSFLSSAKFRVSFIKSLKLAIRFLACFSVCGGFDWLCFVTLGFFVLGLVGSQNRLVFFLQ